MIRFFECFIDTEEKGEFMLLSVFRVCFCYMLLFDREIMIFGAVGKTGIKELLQSHAIAFYFHFV